MEFRIPKKLIICLLAALIYFNNAKGQDYEILSSQLLEKAVAENEVVGIAAGFAIGGETVWVGGAGYADLNKDLKFNPGTLNRIASIAKPMTAVAILQLYESGKLDLNAPVHGYVPDFPKKEDGPITVLQLLQHASGIGAYKNKKERENKIHYKDLHEAMQVFAGRDLVSTPGQEFHYTSYGYVVLGRVIEEVSGMSYENYMQSGIFDPLGMKSTGVEHYGQQYPGKASLYHRNSKGKISEADHHDLSNRVPGGGFYSTVSDILLFGDAILQYKLISKASTDLMFTNSGLKLQGNGYGLGWYLYGENPKYGPVYGHNGAQTGASAFLMLLPQEKTSIIVISNTSGAMQAVSNITVSFFDLAASANQ